VTTAPAPTAPAPTVQGHLRIMRVDHWFKNVFVLPGIVLAIYFFRRDVDAAALLWRVPLGLLALSVAASSNYVLNELLDAPFDRLHPTKWARPVPSGLVHVRLGYVQWMALGVLGLTLAAPLGWAFLSCTAWLLVMGVLYNVPPIRLKDVVFLDVLTESVNNPIRLLAGWFIAVPDARITPLSLLASYFAIGCYFMSLKRFAEYRAIDSPEVAATYRQSFARYDADLLLATTVGYASAAMLFFGAFAVRYRLETLLAFPLIAIVMAVYLMIGLREDSPVQAPEHLYRERELVLACLACSIVVVITLAVDMPWIGELLESDFPERGRAG
jgi:4-hydroxybenzoate polyprenyltransferase